jgi:putative transposase
VVSDLNSDRFKDMAPPQVYSILLDEGVFRCSISTMYRLLRKRGEINERRKQRSHVPAQRPELLATGPNQVWSWDITKLKGPRKWRYLHLFVVIDVFSRFVVGWCIAQKSNARIAEALLQDAVVRERIKPGELTIHADNGGEMTSITVAELLTDLGVVKSHSRPHTSNDNPFSESHFKTMKYRPEIPARFESVEQARLIFRKLFHWYNQVHRHSSLALLTPATVHTGKAQEVTRARAGVLSAAYSAHPERFVNKPPVPAEPPTEVWINPPAVCSEAQCDASEQVEESAAPAGKQELPNTSIHEQSRRQSRTEPSRDGSGGCRAATA